jgi:hypothetical protein
MYLVKKLASYMRGRCQALGGCRETDATTVADYVL